MRRYAAMIVVGLVLLPGGRGLAQASETPDALAAPRAMRRSVVVLSTEGLGIDPVVAPHVTSQLRATAEAMGYALVGDDVRDQAAITVHLPPRPAPADLWRVTFLSHAARGVYARVWAQAGRYVVEIAVASVDGTGPFVGRDSAGADDLLATCDRLLRRLLPSPDEWDADAAEQLAERALAPVARPVVPPTLVPPMSTGSSGWDSGMGTRRHPGRRWDLAVAVESAFGASQGHFYNQLVGARVDYRVNSDILVGAYLGYANLEGRTGRVSNLLGYLQLEYRIRILREDGPSVPLRGAVGYLPYNGSFVRFAGGFNLPIRERFELGIDVLAPTFWFLPAGRAVSFDVALELIVRLGDD